MQIKNINILNFKNIADAQLEFSPRVNCLLGRNGMGKSNLLEALHFLSFARPISSMPESALIRHGEELLLVKGNYEMDNGDTHSVACGIVRPKGKTLKVDGKEYDKISHHIGRFPLVISSPSDTSIVTGSGDLRRRLMDMVISQGEHTYLAQLIRYNRALESRNRLLRAGLKDPLLYESVEAGMEEAAVAVHEGRKRWVESVAPVFADYYRQIAADGETASLSYKSTLNSSSFRHVMDESRAKDIALGFTSRGVHRDDLLMGLGDYSMRTLGSQGQVKTFAIALRLAIFDYLKKARGETPLLLLDDIFDKLDADRVARIMEVVSADLGFGQIFITDTNRKHLDEILYQLSGDQRLYEVADGAFNPIIFPA